jgi:hypothetical protein
MSKPRGSKNRKTAQEITGETSTHSTISISTASQEETPKENREETPEETTIPTEEQETTDEALEQATSIPADSRPAGMRSLKCILTEDERSEYGMALAQFVTELEALEAQKANLPSQIKGVRERMRDTKSAMQNGFEYRDIDCFERDHGATIEVVRSDTGEVVDVRAAKLDDRQTTIFDALDPGAENPLDGEPGDEDGEPYTETDGDPESDPEPVDDPSELA